MSVRAPEPQPPVRPCAQPPPPYWHNASSTGNATDQGRGGGRQSQLVRGGGERRWGAGPPPLGGPGRPEPPQGSRSSAAVCPPPIGARKLLETPRGPAGWGGGALLGVASGSERATSNLQQKHGTQPFGRYHRTSMRGTVRAAAWEEPPRGAGVVGRRQRRAETCWMSSSLAGARQKAARRARRALGTGQGSGGGGGGGAAAGAWPRGRRRPCTARRKPRDRERRGRGGAECQPGKRRKPEPCFESYQPFLTATRLADHNIAACFVCLLGCLVDKKKCRLKRSQA